MAGSTKISKHDKMAEGAQRRVESTGMGMTVPLDEYMSARYHFFSLPAQTPVSGLKSHSQCDQEMTKASYSLTVFILKQLLIVKDGLNAGLSDSKIHILNPLILFNT